jgi:hypothetical protein
LDWIVQYTEGMEHGLLPHGGDTDQATRDRRGGLPMANYRRTWAARPVDPMGGKLWPRVDIVGEHEKHLEYKGNY